MYFKNEYHEETALKLMNLCGFQQIEDDKEYGSFCYVASATEKYDDLEGIVSIDGLDMDTLEQMLLVYSSSERNMIRFALQLFNDGLDDITLPDVFSSLDEKNKLVIGEAIKFRFNIKDLTQIKSI